MKLKGTRGHIANPRSHCAPNHGSRPVQTRLDRFLAETQTFSRFVRTQTFDVPQHEHSAIRFRECIDGLFELAVKFPRIRLALGVRLR
jgi:hypothetical protein